MNTPRQTQWQPAVRAALMATKIFHPHLAEAYEARLGVPGVRVNQAQVADLGEQVRVEHSAQSTQ